MYRFLFALALLGCVETLAAQCSPEKCKVGGKLSPGGQEIQVDLPADLHHRNKGGSNGAGLCVFTSIAHAARWQNVHLLQDFRDYMTKFPGGGYPSKVDAYVQRMAKERGQPVPKYFHYTGRNLDVLQKALESGRMVSVTYRYSPTGRYGGRHIAHMVNLVHLDAQHACVLDNNHIGIDKYEWMPRETFLDVFAGRGSGWAVVLMDPGPPPLPWNQ